MYILTATVRTRRRTPRRDQRTRSSERPSAHRALRPPSPGSCLVAPPPDHPSREGLLIGPQPAHRVGDEKRPVREIAPPLRSEQQASFDPILIGERRLLQRLRRAADEPVPIPQVLRPSG